MLGHHKVKFLNELLLRHSKLVRLKKSSCGATKAEIEHSTCQVAIIIRLNVPFREPITGGQLHPEGGSVLRVRGDRERVQHRIIAGPYIIRRMGSREDAKRRQVSGDWQEI